MVAISVALDPVHETALLVRARGSSSAQREEAFNEVFEAFRKPVLALCFHLTGNGAEAEDAAQDVFLVVFKGLSRFRGESRLSTWIYRIATNLCLDHLRRNRFRSRELTTTNSLDGEEQNLLDRIPDQSVAASPERNLTRRVLREHIGRALGNLSPRERMVFELKHYHGLQLRTVAGILKTTEGTVKNTLFRATHKLRLQLSEIR